MTEYQTKDSGVHQEYESGMRRDSQDGKPRFDLIRTKLQPYEEQMIYRYAMLLARGAEKYSARNWEDGCGEEELERAKASLLRHTEQLVAGETDEDHAAAVWFNTQAIEYFRWRLDSPQNDGLTGAERLAKVARASEINNLALRKATEIRRRERLLVHAKGLDAELVAEAQGLAAQFPDYPADHLLFVAEKAADLINRPPSPSQINDDGTVTFRKGDYDPGYPDENTTQERDDKPVRFEGSSWVVAEPDNN